MLGGADRIRWRVVFRGHVQGVGFRYTAQHVARQYDVTGYVRNRPDGAVELVAEGDPQEVERFVRGLEEEMGSYIRDRQVVTEPATGEFEDFGVRY
jgi:acylphosphatase